jgi:hypothetical protein
MDPRPTFSEWLQAALAVASTTAPELAEAVKVTPAAVYGWLRGERLAGTSVVRVLHALGLSNDPRSDDAWRAYHETMRGRG